MADERFRQDRFSASVFSRRDVGPGLIRRSFWPGFFSRVASRIQWDARVIDLAPAAEAWPGLADERRERLTTLLCGFCVAEDAVAEHLLPYRDASKRASMASDEDLMAWVFFLQRRDEIRHAAFFDRVAGEVLRLPGDTPAERRDAARAHVPAGVPAPPAPPPRGGCAGCSGTPCPPWPASWRRRAASSPRASASTT